MSAVDSIQKAEDGLSLIVRGTGSQATLDQLTGVVKAPTRAEFDSWIAKERTRITATGTGIYVDGEVIGRITGELGERSITIGTGGSNAANAAATHARKVSYLGKVYTLAADANVFGATSGVPTAGNGTTTNDGNYLVDQAASLIYGPKVTNWPAGVSLAATSITTTFATLAALNTYIAANSATLVNGQRFIVTAEPVGTTRHWNGTDVLTATLPGGKTIQLGSSTSTVGATSGVPANATGTNGDVLIDTNTGNAYKKSLGFWSLNYPLSWLSGAGNATMVIFAGQSQANSNGTTGNDVLAPVAGTMANIYTWDPGSNTFLPYQAGTGGTSSAQLKIPSAGSTGGLDLTDYWGSEAEYCRKWSVDNPGLPLFILKKAHSSTSLDQSSRQTGRGCWDPTLTNDLYAELKASVIAAKAALTSAGKTVVMRAFCWTQGEGDTSNTTASNGYQANLTAFIAKCRTDGLIGTTTPFVISKMQINSAWTYPLPVRAAQIAVASTVAYCRLIDCDNLPLFSDNVHYNPNAVVEQGKRFYAATLLASEILSRYVARMTAPPVAARQTLLSTLFDSLLSGSVWGSLNVLQLYASHDAQSSLLNAVTNPSNNGVANGPINATNSGMTFTADRGLLGTSTTSYIDTGVNPATADRLLEQYSGSLSFYTPTVGTQAGVDMGVLDASGTSSIVLQVHNGTPNSIFKYFENGSTGTNVVAPPSSAVGFWSMVRARYTTAGGATNPNNLYHNGALVATDIFTPAGVVSTPTLQVGNRAGSAAGTTRLYAAFAAGGTREAFQEANFNTALTTYLTAIGAQ